MRRMRCCSTGPARWAESSAATVFLRRQGEWLTPRLEDGALPGIRRAMLIEAGLVREATLPVPWLFEAEALCLGNALSLRPVKSVDGQSIGGADIFAAFAAGNKTLGFD